MRNTLQYPVTKDEVVRAIEQALEHELSKGLIGGITPLALSKAKEYIDATAPDFFYETFDPRSEQS